MHSNCRVSLDYRVMDIGKIIIYKEERFKQARQQSENNRNPNFLTSETRETLRLTGTVPYPLRTGHPKEVATVPVSCR